MTPTFIFAGEHKVDGNAYEPLSDDARDYYQGLVDDVYRQFTADVGLGRGVSASTVRGEAFGHGRVLTASAAKAAGMIDQVRTLSETLSAYGVEPQQGSRALAPERRRRSLALMERGVVGSE
jgi:ClpP class serine protease